MSPFNIREHVAAPNRASRKAFFLDALSEYFSEAWKPGTERPLTLAGYGVRFQCASPLFTDDLTKALAHLAAFPSSTPADLTIHIWDASTPPTDRFLATILEKLFSNWSESCGPRGELIGVHGEQVAAVYHPGPDILSVVDRMSGRAYFLKRDLAPLPYWEIGSPFRYISRSWFAARGLQFVHGGAVGTSAGGVLLTAKGGSGKSTTTMLCAKAVMQFEGDDYCLADPRTGYLYSLYNSSKLKGTEDLKRLPDLAGLSRNLDSFQNGGFGKAIYFLSDIWSDRLSSGFPLRAIMLPSVTGSVDSSLELCSPADALMAMMPSTVAQLPAADQSDSDRIAALIERLPAYRLYLGSDIRQTILREVLSRTALVVVLISLASSLRAQTPASAPAQAALLNRYCVTCHSEKLKTGGLSLQGANLTDVPKGAETWEKVIRKLRVGAMPPQGMPRPDKATLDGFATYLETALDRGYSAKPNPGRATMHRLNRTEYGNAIRDLLALDVDATALLPPDDESSGFDNIADVLRVSPSLMERYLSASWNISRLAVGNLSIAPSTATYRVRPDLSQDQHIEGLPLGTRGGILIHHTFPVDGEYIIKVRLWRNTFDLMRGMEDSHQIEISLDGERVRLVTVGGHDDFVKMAANPGSFGTDLDQRLTIRLPVKAGSRAISATTILRSHAEKDDLIKAFMRTTVDGEDITGDPSVDRLSIEGPFNQTGVGDTASRRKIFICQPASAKDELPCARKILSTLARHAYRRPLKDSDLEEPLSFYQRRRNSNGSFDAGIESALQLILASPEFLFRFEPDPANAVAGTPYRIDDIALASRLSFFLWSSIPDDTLLNLAAQGKLKDPAVLDQQIKRMLADPKADALADNFAEQWLFLRNLKNASPNLVDFPDFDDNLREAMLQETKLFFESIQHEDRSVLDLLNADYTFVNERLAKHYGIPDIYGSQFRRVPVTDPARRGLLGQASILTVTSYPNRTSPVQRGKWILTNILGVPPTPPPPNVPQLTENAEGSQPKSVRERMEAHRADSVCAGCHKVMDPVGFALENFDAIGRWRATDDGAKIDPAGVLFNGDHIDGVVGLRQTLTSRPEVFVGVMTEKLLTYALGRGVEYYDMPVVRRIVHDAAAHDYKFSDLIMGVVKSTPFQMKLKAPAVAAGQP